MYRRKRQQEQEKEGEQKGGNLVSMRTHKPAPLNQAKRCHDPDKQTPYLSLKRLSQESQSGGYETQLSKGLGVLFQVPKVVQ